VELTTVPGALPDLIYPNIPWHDDDYASLQGRLDLFSDFIILTKFHKGEATEQFLVDPAEVAACLSKISLNSGLLPDGCLFWSKKEGQDGLGIYVPPKVWLVSIRNEPQAWRAPLPGLILAGHGYDYSLWAVEERPTTREAQLFMAPCPNVSPKGVCRGNAPFPKLSPATIWQAVEVFFSSRFNRDLSNQKSRKYPGCVLDQWRDLHEAGAESYPLDDLVGTNLTLGGLIDAIS
jgi:hypothetical protein